MELQGAGKGPEDRTQSRKQWDKSLVWCDCFPARFRDKCKACNKEKNKNLS